MPYKNQVLVQMEKDAKSENWEWEDDADEQGFTSSVIANSGRNETRRSMTHSAHFTFGEFAEGETAVESMLRMKFKDTVSSKLYLKVLPTVQRLADVASGKIRLAKHDYVTFSYCETEVEYEAVITAIGLRLQLDDRSAIREILEAGPVKNG